MKKMISRMLMAAFAAIFICGGMAAHATTLTGTVNNPDGSAFNGVIYLTLSQASTVSSSGTCGGPIYVSNTYTVGVQVVAGVVTSSPQIYDSSCFMTPGIPYSVRLVSATGQVVQQTWVVTSTPLQTGSENVGTIIPVSVSSVVFQLPAAANITSMLFGATSLPLSTTAPSGSTNYLCNVSGQIIGCAGGGSGSMTWPSGGAGIPNYNGGSAYGSSYNASNPIPANFLSLALQGGTTATTQSVGDNSTKVATDAFVLANGAGGGASTPATNSLLKGNGSANGVVAAGASDVTGAVDGAMYGGINLFGDSITQGTGSSTFMNSGSTARAYAYQLLADFGGNGANYGFGGDQAADMVAKVYAALAPTVARNFIAAMMISTNDANVYGTNTNQQDTFTRALEAAIAWAGVPDVAKVLAAGSKCTPTGTWATDSGSVKSLGYYSVVAGSTLTCTVTTYGNALYIGYEKNDTWGTGSASVTIDGTTPTNDASILSYGLGGSSIATSNGNHGAEALARYAVAAGTHTVVLTTANTSIFEVMWLGGPDPAAAGTIAPPAVLVGGTPWNQTGGSGVPAPSTTAAYNTLIQNAVTALAGDGLNVQFVNVRAYTNGTTDYTGQTLADGYVCGASTLLPYHPGDCGHDHLAQAFRASLNMFPNGQFNNPRPALAIPASGGGASPGGGYSWAFNNNNQDGVRLGLAANGTNEYVDVPTGGTVSIRVAGAIVATFNASGCTTGCGSGGGLPSGLTYSGGVLANTIASGGGGFWIENTASSGSPENIALASQMAGYDTFQFDQWGAGNGAGLAGIFALYDPTAGHIVWNTNANGDFCLGTPVTGVSTCTNSTVIFTRATGAAAFSSTASNPYNFGGSNSSYTLLSISNTSNGTNKWGLGVGPGSGANGSNDNQLFVYDLENGGVPWATVDQGINLASGSVMGWINSTNPTTNLVPDTGFSRGGAGIIDVGNGTAGNAGGTLAALILIGGELEGGTAVGGNYPFLVGTGGNIFSQQVTAATSGANQSGHNVELEASYWTGSASATDTWFIQNVLGTGANPTSTLTLSHTGSPGAAIVALPAVTATSLNGMTTPTPAGNANFTQTINHGTIAMEGGTAIASGACATVVTVASASVATTDVVSVGFNADETAVTGYIPGAALTPYPYPTAGNINVKLCNETASSITPTAITLNWTVQR